MSNTELNSVLDEYPRIFNKLFEVNLHQSENVFNFKQQYMYVDTCKTVMFILIFSAKK